MSSAYYSRLLIRQDDGSLVFATDEDTDNEKETAAFLEKVWDCEIHSFGRFCPVDFYALRKGQMVAVLELKCRSHASTTFSTVFLNVRKWGNLMSYQTGLGCPAIFVVRFLDGCFWIPVSAVDASKWRIGGTKRLVKSYTDIEPVIEVPIIEMNKLTGGSHGF